MRPVFVGPHTRVALLALCSVLSGCYYYAPYGYVPYSEAVESSEFAFTMPSAVAGETPASNALVPTSTYIATTTPVFVAPAYYAPTYPYYGGPAWWQPSVSVGFGYWGGCCYGGGRHGYWGHRGYGGYGGYWSHRGYGGHSGGYGGYRHRGGWGGHGGWSGRGQGSQGMRGGHSGGGGGHGRPR